VRLFATFFVLLLSAPDVIFTLLQLVVLVI
jgi:hypothetical protein